MKLALNERRRASALKWFLLLLASAVAAFFVVVLTAYWSLRPDRLFREIEASVFSALSEGPPLGVALRAPSGLVSLARFGLSFVDDIDEEGRLAVAAVRRAQAGVYPLLGRVGKEARTRMLHRADEAMERHDWERVAAVFEGDEVVLVYVPSEPRAECHLEAYAVVVHEEQLVIASVSGDLRPLFELVHDKMLAAR